MHQKKANSETLCKIWFVRFAGKNDEKRAMVCTGQYVFFGLSAKGTIILIVVIQ